MFQHSLSQSLPIYCYALDINKQKWRTAREFASCRRRQLLENLLAARKDPLRLSPLLQAPSLQIFEAVRKLGLEGVGGKRIDSRTNPVSDLVPGSSFARTWNKSSSSGLRPGSATAREMEQCRWVKPRLVCQVAFVEWTDAGHLRHCTFVAMRDDKKPAEVVRERELAKRGNRRGL